MRERARALEFDRPDARFKRDFLDRSFGYSCAVCDRLWFDNNLRGARSHGAEAPAAQRAVTSRRGERCGAGTGRAQPRSGGRSARSHVGCDVAAPLLQTLLSAPRAVARGEEEERGCRRIQGRL